MIRCGAQRLGLKRSRIRRPALREGIGHRLPVAPGAAHGETRVSQVPGSSSSCAPRPPTSPDALRTRPLPCGSPWPSRGATLWASGIVTISRLERRGSQRCAPTHRPDRYRPDRKAHFRLAGLSPLRTGFAPAGRQTRISEAIASSFPSRPALPGRTAPLFEPLRGEFGEGPRR